MRNKAFTLVELLTAMAVTCLLVGVMLQVFSLGSSTWKRVDEKLDTFREARAAIQIMSRDFASISQVPGAPAGLSTLTLDWHPDTQMPDRVNQEAYLLTTSRNRGRSDLCAVGYFCTWDNEIGAFSLRRQFTDSDTSFAALQRAALLKPAAALAVFPLVHARSKELDTLAAYIWELQFLVPDHANPDQFAPWPAGFFARELPPWVEIRFKALGTQAARIVTSEGATRQHWFPGTGDHLDTSHKAFFDRKILPQMQEFSTRVKLGK